MVNFHDYDKIRLLLVLLIVTTVNISCSRFLEATPDSNLNTISGLADLQKLLDHSSHNAEYPAAAQIGSDDYYLTSADWSSMINSNDKNLHIWSEDAVGDDEWYYCYKKIFEHNIVLEELQKIKRTEANKEEYNQIKGSALFLRSYSFYHLAELFAPQYSPRTLNDQGIVLRVASDINAPSVRASVEETYERIIKDCLEAQSLLPKTKVFNTRPSRAAVWALLAKVYLATANYELAAQSADSSLSYYNYLLDYNSLDTLATVPFIPQANTEIVFQSVIRGSSPMLPSICKVDTVLLALYGRDDLRRKLFYQRNADGSHRFKGNYNGTRTDILFNGLAVDEMYLISAECNVRLDKLSAAMADINALLVKRYARDTYVPYEIRDKYAALALIIDERRKELAFRSARWSDLRRFNLEEGLRDTIVRKLNNKQYELLPNSNQYILELTEQP